MSLLDSISDYLFTDTSKTQTFDEALANTARLNDLVGTNVTLQDPGSASVDAALNSATFGILGDAGNQPDGGNPTGVAALVKDVLILAFIGGAIYLFVKLGGINQIKKIVS
jgi:hypothetical protein